AKNRRSLVDEEDRQRFNLFASIWGLETEDARMRLQHQATALSLGSRALPDNNLLTASVRHPHALGLLVRNANPVDLRALRRLRILLGSPGFLLREQHRFR